MHDWLQISHELKDAHHDADSVDRTALLKAVTSICTADLIVQRAPVKSHRSQGHVERAVRLVDNQYRALLFDVQERTRVEIDPISAASAWILRHSVWLLNRCQPHKGDFWSDIIRTLSQEVHTDLQFFRWSPWWSVWYHQIENLEEFSWLRKEHTNISINVGWSHRGKR